MIGTAAAEIVEEVRPAMVRFARWLGVDQDTAEDFPQEFYLFLLGFENDVIAPHRLATRMVKYYALREFARRRRLVRVLRDNNGAEVPAVDLLADTIGEDAYWTSTQRYGGRSYHSTDVQPPGICWRCKGPTNRPNPHVRYCLECVRATSRYTGRMAANYAVKNSRVAPRDGLWATSQLDTSVRPSL